MEIKSNSFMIQIHTLLSLLPRWCELLHHESLIKDLWFMGTCLSLVLSPQWVPSQREVEGAACWRLQAVNSSWHCGSKRLWMLKELSEVVAGLSQLGAGYLFQPSTFSPVQLFTCTFTPSFWFNCSVLSPSFFFFIWFMICSEILNFTLWFWLLHFSSVYFAMFTFQIPTYYVFVLCSSKSHFLAYSQLHHMWFLPHRPWQSRVLKMWKWPANG